MNDLNIKNHHAYLIIGGEETLPKLHSLLKKKLDFSISGNPDYHFEEIETLGIEESRGLKETHSKKALGENKVFVVKTKFITHEAQNALLKILEDPLPNSFFFFIMPSEEYIYPTLLSRFMIIKEKKETEEKSEEGEKVDAGHFLSLNQTARIKLLSKIINSKDKNSALKFINLLEEKLHEKLYPFSSKEEREVMDLVLKSKKNIYSRGASLKIVLENLSLSIPKSL